MSHVTVEGRTLAAAMKAATTVIERRNTIPILSNVRLTAAGPKLVIRATDLDMELSLTIDVIDIGDGLDITVPAHKLAAIADKAGPAPVRIETEEQEHSRPARKGETPEKWLKTIAHVDVADGDARYVLETQPASDWPEITLDPDKLVAASHFTNGRLVDLVKTVAPAISTEETRYYLNGIHYKPGLVEATDGHRLIRAVYDKEEAGDWNVIIPRKVCYFLAKHATTDCALSIDAGRMRMKAAMPAMSFACKLIDGTYPDADRVIPKYEEVTGYRIEFDAAVLRAAIERVVLMSNERGRAVKFTNDDGKISVAVDNPGFGTAKAKTFVDWPKNAGTSFGFNGRYLMQSVPKSGKVTFEQNDHGSPCVIRHDEEKDVLRIVMPMRV